MFRHVCIAAIATAALSGLSTPAQATCPISEETPPAGLGVCYSLVDDCVRVAVYYRVPVLSPGNVTTRPICP
jgi:hypothetical protein